MRKPDIEKMQAFCDNFNEKYPVGSSLQLKKDFRDEWVTARVKGEACILSGHTPVAFFEGERECYAIEGRIKD